MEKLIIKKIERVNKMLIEIGRELEKENINDFTKGLNEGQKISYTFMKSELEDLLWHYNREKQC